MRFLTVFLFIFLICSPAWATIELYTVADGNRPRPVTDMYSILEEFRDNYSDKNILFYVHGRKRLVQKEIERIRNIESFYGLKVVMLHWDSYQTLVTRPVENAKIASDSLHESFEAIRRFRDDNPDYFTNHALNLLCHSMGNLVLKYTVEKYYLNANTEDKIFTNFVSSGADVPLKDHGEWLSQFKLAEQNFIMLNSQDLVLLMSYSLDVRIHNPFTYRLGLGFDNIVGLKDHIMKKLVPTTKYIDLSRMLATDHGYFLSKNKIMKYIFDTLLNGQDFTLEKSSFPKKMNLSQHKSKKNIYYVSQ